MTTFRAKLETTLNLHFNELRKDGSAAPRIKGRSADGNGAIAFYLMYGITHDQKFRQAALSPADDFLKDLRATKFGVLSIKAKAKLGGKTILNAAVDHFPIGNGGQDGAHAAEPSSLILHGL